MHIGVVKLSKESYVYSVWAPRAEQVALEITEPRRKNIELRPCARGYWTSGPFTAGPGDRYRVILDGSVARPDPASHYQPDGVHEASAIVDHEEFTWTDEGFRPVPLSDMILYELHVGCFSEAGTFDGVVGKLDHLKELGITAVEVMPIAQFPGDRNWGYDGVNLFAVQASYGGSNGFKRLVNACHERGLSVILDVVYNHLGPEGNYLREFGPYFTDAYSTPWGEAVNFDGEMSDEVRAYFIQNALHWLGVYHVDGLRLDAIHAIYDQRPDPFLRELAREVHRFGRSVGRPKLLFPETNLNDPRLVTADEAGGMGLDCVWNDDFHHSAHTLFTGEKGGYYVDYGGIGPLRRCLAEGFAYQGEYSEFRKRSHGDVCGGLPGEAFLIALQNHDQVGNRLAADRLSALISFEALKTAAGLLLLAPYVPMLFMGEEYGEDNPFQYFVSHGDPDLIEAVRKGRAEEFKSFNWPGEPPDPQNPEVFPQSKLSWEKMSSGRHAVLFNYYKNLISLRKRHEALRCPDKRGLTVIDNPDKRLLLMRRSRGPSEAVCLFNLSEEIREVFLGDYFPETERVKMFDSADVAWEGPGATASPSTVEPVRLRGLSLTVYGAEGESV